MLSQKPSLLFRFEAKIARVWTNFVLARIFFAMGKGCLFFGPRHLFGTRFVSIGDEVKIGPYCRVEAYGEQGNAPKLIIGDRCCIEHAVHIYAATSLIIGADTLIASGCMITDNNHGTNPNNGPYIRQLLDSKVTKIGRGVWLGEHVSVLPGADIGDFCVIGANSVVTGSIAEYSMAVGAPARVIKTFDRARGIWTNSINVD